MKVLTLQLADDLYAVDLLYVREVIELLLDSGSSSRTTHITQVPLSSKDVWGVINLRGYVIPVSDLRQKLGMQRVAPTVQSRIVILDGSYRSDKERDDVASWMGVVVDSVHEVVDLDEEEINPPPRSGMKNNRLHGISHHQGTTVQILEVSALFQTEAAENKRVEGRRIAPLANNAPSARPSPPALKPSGSAPVLSPPTAAPVTQPPTPVTLAASEPPVSEPVPPPPSDEDAEQEPPLSSETPAVAVESSNAVPETERADPPLPEVDCPPHDPDCHMEEVLPMAVAEVQATVREETPDSTDAEESVVSALPLLAAISEPEMLQAQGEMVDLCVEDNPATCDDHCPAAPDVHGIVIVLDETVAEDKSTPEHAENDFSATALVETASVVEELAVASAVSDDEAPADAEPEEATEEVTPIIEAPETIVEAPEIMPEETEASVEAPEIMPEETEASVEAPEIMPEGTEASAEAPEIMPEETEASDEVPEIIPEEPKIIPEEPETIVEAPEIMPEETEASAEAPEIIPEEPETIVEAPEIIPETPEASVEEPAITKKVKKRKDKPEKVESVINGDDQGTTSPSDAPSPGEERTDRHDKNEVDGTEVEVEEAAAFLAEMAAIHPTPRNVVTDFQSIFRDLLPLTTLNRESSSWGDNKSVDKQKPEKTKKGKKGE
ncbi:MAG: chemotaxis protein CheW [Magnetococcales bacterium]|nr:chemotaxis protein CheW [Magnetococcales bacterium]MBF0114618.1 chemotaxis protein CheW [Magnetococcales bacterium]